MSNADDCAFPTSQESYGGLTKREYAAIQIAAGLFGNSLYNHLESADVAKMALIATDAVLAELEKPA